MNNQRKVNKKVDMVSSREENKMKNSIKPEQMFSIFLTFP